MPRYEYKVVPAPTKGLKAKGVKSAEARFAHAVQVLMNDLSGDGWEYQRAETLPSTERAGLTGSTTEWRNMLVFRRVRESDAEAFAPELLPAPVAVAAPKEVPPVPAKDTPPKTAPAVETASTPEKAPETRAAASPQRSTDTPANSSATERLADIRNDIKSDT
jgi:hypothetical protein